MHAVQQEHPLLKARQEAVDLGPVERLPGRRGRTLQAVEHAGLVAGRLQTAEKPGAGVRQSLVVEVDRILGGEHDAQTVGAGLLEEREDRRLARRVGGRRQVAEDLVHQKQRLERRRAPLGSHPGHGLPREQRHERHPLAVVEMRDRDDGHPRLAGRRPEQAAHVERIPFEPGLEAGRGRHRVELAGQLEAVAGGIKILEVEKPDPFDRWRRDRPHQGPEVELLAAPPHGVDDRGEQHVFAALARLRVDADQRQDARHERLDPLAPCLGVVEHVSRRWIEALEHRQRPTRATARRVDRHVDRLVQTADPLGRLPAGGESVGPLLRRPFGKLLDRDPVALRGVGFDPRQEVGRRESWKREEHVGEVALGVDDERGNAVDRRLLDEVDEQTRLAAAGHAHADGVGGEPSRIDQKRLSAQGTASRTAGRAAAGIDLAAEIEDSQPLDIGRRLDGLAACRVTACRFSRCHDAVRWERNSAGEWCGCRTSGLHSTALRQILQILHILGRSRRWNAEQPGCGLVEGPHQGIGPQAQQKQGCQQRGQRHPFPR